MESCTGDGICFKQCDHHGNMKHEKFIGGTSRCDVFCKVACQHNCQLEPCSNYALCLQKRPQYYLDFHGGMCMNCVPLSS